MMMRSAPEKKKLMLREQRAPNFRRCEQSRLPGSPLGLWTDCMSKEKMGVI
jgi:hypothetical protein